MIFAVELEFSYSLYGQRRVLGLGLLVGALGQESAISHCLFLASSDTMRQTALYTSFRPPRSDLIAGDEADRRLAIRQGRTKLPVPARVPDATMNAAMTAADRTIADLEFAIAGETARLAWRRKISAVPGDGRLVAKQDAPPPGAPRRRKARTLATRTYERLAPEPVDVTEGAIWGSWDWISEAENAANAAGYADRMARLKEDWIASMARKAEADAEQLEATTETTSLVEAWEKIDATRVAELIPILEKAIVADVQAQQRKVDLKVAAEAKLKAVEAFDGRIVAARLIQHGYRALCRRRARTKKKGAVLRRGFQGGWLEADAGNVVAEGPKAQQKADMRAAIEAKARAKKRGASRHSLRTTQVHLAAVDKKAAVDDTSAGGHKKTFRASAENPMLNVG